MSTLVKNIIVNATALCSSGGLIILQQFVSNIPRSNDIYYIFINKNVQFTEQKNVRFIPTNKKNLIERFWWDAYGLNIWIKKNKIIPNTIISLQNTSIRTSFSSKKIIYYHNIISLSEHSWNIFKKSERTLWFYKHVYPVFVKLFLDKHTQVFVQLEYIKKAFIQKFGVIADNVHVIFPDLKTPEPENFMGLELPENQVCFFYPAVSFEYKNHNILFEAFLHIDSKLTKRITVYFTCNKDELNVKYHFKNIDIIFLGSIPHAQVMWIYERVNALLFPSYIESFGLPLIEAASTGIKILAPDLPYSREVLNGYNGVKFIDYNDSVIWGDNILEICNNPLRGNNQFTFQYQSWSYLFNYLDNNLNSK